MSPPTLLAAVVTAPTLDDYDRTNYRAVVQLVERPLDRAATRPQTGVGSGVASTTTPLPCPG